MVSQHAIPFITVWCMYVRLGNIESVQRRSTKEQGKNPFLYSVREKRASTFSRYAGNGVQGTELFFCHSGLAFGLIDCMEGRWLARLHCEGCYCLLALYISAYNC